MPRLCVNDTWKPRCPRCMVSVPTATQAAWLGLSAQSQPLPSVPYIKLRACDGGSWRMPNRLFFQVKLWRRSCSIRCWKARLSQPLSPAPEHQVPRGQEDARDMVAGLQPSSLFLKPRQSLGDSISRRFSLCSKTQVVWETKHPSTTTSLFPSDILSVFSSNGLKLS